MAYHATYWAARESAALDAAARLTADGVYPSAVRLARVLDIPDTTATDLIARLRRRGAWPHEVKAKGPAAERAARRAEQEARVLAAWRAAVEQGRRPTERLLAVRLGWGCSTVRAVVLRLAEQGRLPGCPPPRPPAKSGPSEGVKDAAGGVTAEEISGAWSAAERRRRARHAGSMRRVEIRECRVSLEAKGRR